MYKSIEKEHLPEIDSGTSFFLLQTFYILEKNSIYLEDELQILLVLPAEPGRDLGKHCFQNGKVRLAFYMYLLL